jgi:DNA-directed RNA polymerase subunit RPC12/RpoP
VVQTKYVLLTVLCEGCETDLPFTGIKNYEQLKCDRCGLVKANVTFREA